MRIALTTLMIVWAVSVSGAAASQDDKREPEQASERAAKRTWTGKLNLGIPSTASAELITEFVRWRISAPDIRAVAERAIQTWEAEELAYEARELASLQEQVASVTGGVNGRWFEEEDRRVAFLAVVKERARLMSRRNAREAALLATLASLAEEDPNSEPWMALAGDCEAKRACAISTALPGAQSNLSWVLAAMLDETSFPMGDDPLSAARRRYLCEMSPLWASKQAAWDEQLGKIHSRESANPPTRKAAMERMSAVCLAIQLANERWASYFASLVGGAESSRMEWRLLTSLCPTASIGWACSFEPLLKAAAESCDPVTAKAAVLNLKSRCEILRDLAWQADRARFVRMLAGGGVKKVDHEEGRKRLLASLLEEVAIHRVILEDGLGINLADDPCLVALQRIAESVQSGSPSWLAPSDVDPRSILER